MLRRDWGKLSLVAVVTAVLMCTAFLVRSPHLWRKYDDVEVLRNGHLVSEARVYQSSGGLLFIDLGNDEELYSFSNSNDRPPSGWCDLFRRITLPGHVYMIDDGQDMPCVPYNDVKISDPHLIVQSEFVEFDSKVDGRIGLVWKPAS